MFFLLYVYNICIEFYISQEFLVISEMDNKVYSKYMYVLIDLDILFYRFYC